jgi:hypothetical protein
MTWTERMQGTHARKTTRYPGDLTDAEWAVVGPLLFGPCRKVYRQGP